ncbi:MAG: V-type H(+)-translocating pyrophosphatase [SAR324 cluster bacterium]|nr:V-type H(+)-translocating pyrophosphatase [SAR324 cluster bacterium]
MSLVGIIILILSLLGLVVAYFYSRQVLAVAKYPKDASEKEKSKLSEIHQAILEGSMAFLAQEYKYMALFTIFFAIFIGLLLNNPSHGFNDGIYTSVAFIAGCSISVLSGFIGMKIATAGNVRTTASAKTSLAAAFKTALHSGAVMGFGLVGLSSLGLYLVYLLTAKLVPAGVDSSTIMEIVAGFGLGGSAIALFARVGGGIYTKAADVGADLVGKVEKGIPEDDPRNPAVIADNVGDNVGDVAGMGADLFGSSAESTCAALVIGAIAFPGNLGAGLYPILITALGIPVSLIAMFFIKVKKEEDVGSVLKRLLIISTFLGAVAVYFASIWLIPAQYELGGQVFTGEGVYICYLSGLLAGLFIGLITEYFTSHKYKPVKDLSKSCETGAATNIIFGMALGFKSSGWTILAIAVSVFIPFYIGGMYGVAISALGMLGTLVITLTIDAYGPVSDNAGGIAQMAGLDSEIRDRTDVLDAAGNTTAAIGKGLAIGSAILTSLALFSAFLTRAEDISINNPSMLNFSLDNINLLDPFVLGGLFLGSTLPFLFSAMTMKSVGKAAFDMIEEVRRQMKEKPGIMAGTDKPDYGRCVSISTKAALREMILPGVLIIGSPLAIGFLFGIKALAGVLMGSLLVSAGLAVTQTNAGGAWDNAKKYIEKGFLGGKGSDAHKAAVIGDTVGDPFKDTSGPSLNILMKLSAILSLVFVPFFAKYGGILVKFLE